MKKALCPLLALCLLAAPLAAQQPPASPAAAEQAADAQAAVHAAFSLRWGYEVGFRLAQAMPAGLMSPQDFCQTVRTMLETNVVENPESFSDELIDKLTALMEHEKWERGMKALEDGRKFMEARAANPAVKRLPNGVCYELTSQGKGEVYSPAKHGGKALVKMRYSVGTTDGRKLADFMAEPVDYITDCGPSIPGVDALLQHLPAGSVCRAYIPAQLCFGAQEIVDEVAMLRLPANSTVVMDIAVESYARQDAYTDSAIPVRPLEEWVEPAKPAPLTPAEQEHLRKGITAVAALQFKDMEDELPAGFLRQGEFMAGLERALTPGAQPVPTLSDEVMEAYARARRERAGLREPMPAEGQGGEIQLLGPDGKKAGSIAPAPEGGVEIRAAEDAGEGQGAVTPPAPAK